MKESRFIKNNVDSWKAYEKVVKSKDEKPLNLSQLFVKITDDLSYANTYYKNRAVRVYLNGLAKLLFQKVNNSEGFRFTSIKKFYTETIPLAIYKSRFEFFISLTIFILSMAIGILSSKYEPDFAQLILGQEYIEMTNKNIAENDPMAVYKSQAPFDMFFAITVNNTLVAAKTFVSGLFMAIGSIFIMIYNGIMVGSFQYFFIEQGLFKSSFLTIWQHGVLEISSIIMAGAAGIVLGKGLIFPGNYTRFQSLRISAHKGLMLLLGILPILVIAGFIEGFYTRFTGAPDAIRILTILLSLTFIIMYFIYLPRKRSKQNITNSFSKFEVEFSDKKEINQHEIYNGSELFMLTFNKVKTKLGENFKAIIISSVIAPVLLALTEIIDLHHPSNLNLNFSFIDVFIENKSGIVILLLSFLTLASFKNRMLSDALPKVDSIWFALQILPLLCIILFPLLIPHIFLGILISSILMMFGLLSFNIITIEHKNFITAISHTFKYLNSNFGKLLGLFARFFILGVLFYYTFSFLTQYINEFIQLNLFGDNSTKYKIMFYINCFYNVFVLMVVTSIIYSGFNLLYYSIYESMYATHLQDRIKRIGKTKRIKGLIRE